MRSHFGLLTLFTIISHTVSASYQNLGNVTLDLNQEKFKKYDKEHPSKYWLSPLLFGMSVNATTEAEGIANCQNLWCETTKGCAYLFVDYISYVDKAICRGYLEDFYDVTPVNYKNGIHNKTKAITVFKRVDDGNAKRFRRSIAM